MVGKRYPSPGERVHQLVEFVEDLPDGIPLLIGGNGTRVLHLAARKAQIVGMSGLGRTLEDGHRHEVRWSLSAIDDRVAIVRAAGRSPVLDALVQHFQITDERAAVAETLASRVQGLTPSDALAAPYALFGSVAQLADEVARHRERWGFTSYVVRADAIDAAARLLTQVP
jgi:hypothetical protein